MIVNSVTFSEKFIRMIRKQVRIGASQNCLYLNTLENANKL